MNTFLEIVSSITSPISIHTWISFCVGLLGVIAGYLIGSFIKKSLLNLSTHTGHHALFMALAANISKVLCICIGILFFIATLGINISSIIQAITLLSVGLGFIFKDLLGDIVAGFFLVSYKPLSLGLEVMVTTEKTCYTGRIRSLDLRYITLENEHQTILVPNSYLFRQPLCIIKNK